MRPLRGLWFVLCLLLCSASYASTGALAIGASAGGEALSEWRVSVAGYDYQGNTVYPSATLVLNEDGTRTVEPVPVGYYYVGLVGEDGYTLDSGSTAYVQVTAGGTATADLVAWPYVGIHGIVRDNHGVALDGWQVTLTDYNGHSVGPQGTHDGGLFAFASLPDGTWTAQLAPRTCYDAWGGTSVSIYANSGTDGELNLTVYCWANLLGTIDAGTAAGRAGWTVTLLDYIWQPLGTAGPTGNDGQFRFDSLPDGGYHLQLSAHDGWDAPPATDAWCYAGSDTEVTVPVEPWGRLSGVVRLADGTKLSGWTVTCRGWGQPDRVATSAAVTGAFDFGALPDGYYTVDLTPQGAYDAPSTASCYLYGGHDESLTLTPVPWGHVEGSLHAEGGAPLEGWTVTLSGNGVLQTKSSLPDGSFVFEPTADGYYEVNATPQGAYNAPWPAWASVTGGQTSPVSLTAVKWGDLRVNVVDQQGTAQSGWQVTVLDQTGAVRDVQTTTGGQLFFADLPDGWYTVVPTARTGWNAWSGYATVNAGQTSEATITVIPWGGVDGVLVDQLDRPVGGWTVDLVQNGNIVATAPTDAATGVFTFTTQPDGGYSLQVEQPEDCYDECWGGWVQINAGSQTPTRLQVTLMGTLAGTITDADSDPAGAPLQYVSVRLDEWTTTWTNADGHYEFPPVPIGEHQVACSPGPRYGVPWGRWDERTVTVAHAETLEADWGLRRLAPDVAVDVLAPTGTVGNAVTVKYTVRHQPMVYDPQEVVLWSWDRGAQYAVRLPIWASPTGSVWSADGLTVTESYEAVWDTAGGSWYNREISIRGGGIFGNPFGPAPIRAGALSTGPTDEGAAGGASVAANVQNVVIADVSASPGTPDFFLYDPLAGPETPSAEPLICFTIVDRGQVAKEGSPYNYDWTVFIRDTRAATWVDYWYVQGSASAPGQVEVAVPAGSLPDRGTYAFEIRVTERETSDTTWYKDPYRLQMPLMAPDGLPGHRFTISWTGAEYVLSADYWLADNAGKNATSVWLDVIGPDLQLMFHRESLPSTVGQRHSVEVARLPDIPAGTIICAFGAEDSHGDDSPAVDSFAPLAYRDGANKHMMTVNYRVPVDFTLTWEPVRSSGGNPQELAWSQVTVPALGGALPYMRMFADLPVPSWRNFVHDVAYPPMPTGWIESDSDKVKLVVRMRRPTPTTVYLKLLDPDDVTQDTRLADRTDSLAGAPVQRYGPEDNAADFRFVGPTGAEARGAVLALPLTADAAHTGWQTGEVTVQVSRCPGDNCVAVCTLAEADCRGVTTLAAEEGQWDGVRALDRPLAQLAALLGWNRGRCTPVPLGGRTLPWSAIPDCAASPLLTVWRRLHVEQDTMGDVSALNRTSATLVTVSQLANGLSELRVAPDDWQEGPVVGGRFAGGQLFWTDAAGVEQHSAIVGFAWWPDGWTIDVREEPARFQGVAAVAVHDDDHYDRWFAQAQPGAADQFAARDLGFSDDRFSDACISVRGLPVELNFHPTLEPMANLSPLAVEASLGPPGSNPCRDLVSTGDYWCAYIVNCYQSRWEEDFDPDNELVLNGPGGNGRNAAFAMTGRLAAACVYAEGLREWVLRGGATAANFDRRADATLAHELGHLFLGEHQDGGLMGAVGEDERFSPTSIGKLRNLLGPLAFER